MPTRRPAAAQAAPDSVREAKTDPLPAVTPAAAGTVPPSLLERLRRNRMGGLAAGLGVAVVLGSLLSILVPDDHVLLALVILGAALSAAVGFTVRYLTYNRSLLTQLAAFVSAAIGAHVMSVAGSVNQSASGLFELIGGQGPSWEDSMLSALAMPTVSTGAMLCGLVAAVIAGWGPHARN